MIAAAPRPKKPAPLAPGDTIAVLSMSWGGPSAFPHIFEAGLRALRETFGLSIREYPTTRASPELLAEHPERRAEDVMSAFADGSVKAIFASIGGDDSFRVLPHLDARLIAAHPKILLGYSDTTSLLVYANALGLVTFHGPSVMAGFAQLPNLPKAFERHVKHALFDGSPRAYEPYEARCDGYPPWSNPDHCGLTNELVPNTEGFRFVQGRGEARGALAGGCIETLESLKATPFWPGAEYWRGRVLFLETSEETPSVDEVRGWLRDYGARGILGDLRALLFGRAYGYADGEKRALERAIVEVVGEYGREDLPVVANVDFGHTDPQLVLPLGVEVHVSCEERALSRTESPFA